MCHIGKRYGHFHGIFRSSCDVPPLTGGLLLFAQVGLRFNEVGLELSPGIFRIRLGAPGPTVFLTLTCLREEAICDTYDLSRCDGLS